ncbi:MAG: PfkB family carbohydrate kinase [Muribaculaceae bacterium]|nr:PfkB family carbohydrate kinase [Muribaculaceae bacterium]
MSNRIIVIADADYQITFDRLNPTGATPGGTLLNTACELARRQFDVALASEVGNDIVGDIIIDRLNSCGVDTHSVDRAVNCATPATLIFTDGKRTTMRYTRCETDSEGFDIVWPEINPGDTVLFGGFIAINPRCRNRLLQLLSHAAERKADIIYFPGFDPTRISRITKVMPMIFENLEIAGSVITRTCDIEYIFGKSDPQKAFNDHIDFYVDRYCNIAPDGNILLFNINGTIDSAKISPASDVGMISEVIALKFLN